MIGEEEYCKVVFLFILLANIYLLVHGAATLSIPEPILKTRTHVRMKARAPKHPDWAVGSRIVQVEVEANDILLTFVTTLIDGGGGEGVREKLS